MELKRVVVTGLGALTPIGKNVDEYWASLENGVSGADTITRFDTSNFKTTFACEVKNFNAADFLDRKEARKLDLFSQFGLVATAEAIKDAGIEPGNFEPHRAGVIWGSGIGGLETFFAEATEFERGGRIPRFNPFFIPKMIPDIMAGHASIKYQFRGPNYATVAACASSCIAIIDAFNLIRLGKADVFITGGSEAAVNEGGIGGFNALHAISTRNDDPKTASRPFDLDRDGFVLGEGAGVVILEEYEHAKKRGAKIYCEVGGGGLSGDAHHITASHPEGVGAYHSMMSAIDDAELKPEDIDYINVHGTSTPVGDLSEPLAIKNVFGDHAYKLSISATKSMTGHLLGAAGAAEAIATILAIKNDIVPPTINHFTDDPRIDNKLDFTYNKAKKRVINAAICNTFGFGGHNSTALFKKLK
ncbi:beta-ketoacyl-ACP synthase II [Bacteroidota bacterium]